MLIKELPEILSEKTFWNIQDLMDFIYEHQIITEVWEVAISELTPSMLQDLEEAKQLQESDFVNI